jgi:hypothetical protein
MSKISVTKIDLSNATERTPKQNDVSRYWKEKSYQAAVNGKLNKDQINQVPVMAPRGIMKLEMSKNQINVRSVRGNSNPEHG